MINDDALWSAGRAGGVDDVSGVLRLEAALRSAGRLLGDRLGLRVQADDADAVDGQLCAQCLLSDEDRCTSVGKHEGKPFGRIARVERQIGAPGLEDAEKSRPASPPSARGTDLPPPRGRSRARADDAPVGSSARRAGHTLMSSSSNTAATASGVLATCAANSSGQVTAGIDRAVSFHVRSILCRSAGARMLDFPMICLWVGASSTSRLPPGPSSRAITAACATSPWRTSAASISPGSMRKPRTFTCASARPRNSSTPSPRQRARSPVRYIRLPAAPNGSATNRSAVRPASPHIAPRKARPRYVKLPAHTSRYRLQTTVQNVNPRVRYGSADRNGIGKVALASHREAGAERCPFGRTIAVDQPATVLRRNEPAHVRNRQNIAARQQLPYTGDRRKVVIDHPMKQRRCQPQHADTSIRDRALEAGISSGPSGEMTSLAPLSNAPQISNVEASNESGAKCRKTSSGVSST